MPLERSFLLAVQKMNKGAICENWKVSKELYLGERERVKSGHSGNTGGSRTERRWHSKEQMTLDSVKLS